MFQAYHIQCSIFIFKLRGVQFVKSGDWQSRTFTLCLGYFIGFTWTDLFLVQIFNLELINFYNFQAGAAGGAMAGTMATSDGHRYIIMVVITLSWALANMILILTIVVIINEMYAEKFGKLNNSWNILQTTKVNIPNHSGQLNSKVFPNVLLSLNLHVF